MAFLQVNFFSSVLGKSTNMNVILPQTAAGHIGIDGDAGDTYPVLFLLHGMSDDYSAWMRYTSVERYAVERGLSVVMPDGALSFYTDMVHGRKYFEFITEELPAVCRDFFPRMSQRRDGRFIAGLSMGGYGALKASLTCPQTYGAAASLSGVVDIQEFCRMSHEGRRKILSEDFPDIDAVAGTDDDIFYLAERTAGRGEKPRIFLRCGTEDILIDMHRRASDHFLGLGYDIDSSERQGAHRWDFWDKNICDALDFLLAKPE